MRNPVRSIVFLFLFSLWICPAWAQEAGIYTQCSKAKKDNHVAAKMTAANPAEMQYDVSYVKFDLSFTNTSTAVSGSVTTTAKVVAAQMPAYFFELTPELTIDSVKFNGQLLTVLSDSLTRHVVLSAPLTHGAVFAVQVFYHGTPVSGTSFIGKGLSNLPDDTWSTRVTYTLSEPYESKDWWPCKQILTDKIDSTDMFVTVADSLKAGSNGQLVSVTPINGNRVVYHWKLNYPVAYYLVSVSVGVYQEYSYYQHFTGSNDSMLVKNYIYNRPQILTNEKPHLDTTGLFLDHYSQLFGRYPFWQEKYGHCLSPLSGGMENQTMTTCGNFGFALVAHELAHQWFGDYVTCASWRDIWLNESFATYCEYLSHQYLRDKADVQLFVRNMHNAVLLDKPQTGTVYVYDTTDENRVFDGRLSYYKGASVLHMLRFMVGNDSVFFSILKTHLQAHAYSTATTEDFKHTAEQVLQRNLDTFFNQWIYREGYPDINAQWSQIAQHVVVRVQQQGTVPGSVAAFSTPLGLRFRSSDRDTVVIVYMSKPSEDFYFEWNGKIDSVEIDPDDWILNLGGNTARNTDLAPTADAEPFVYPNPAFKAWHVAALPPGTDMRVTDMAGRMVSGQHVIAGAAIIPNEAFLPGFYILRLKMPDGKNKMIKLLKL